MRDFKVILSLTPSAAYIKDCFENLIQNQVLLSPPGKSGISFSGGLMIPFSSPKAAGRDSRDDFFLLCLLCYVVL